MAQSTKPDGKSDFVLQKAAWIGPHLYAKDDVIGMTPAQARYYVPHVLKPKEPDVAQPAKAAKATKS